MLRNLLIINLIFASFAALSCKTEISQNSETEIINIAPAEVKQETPQPQKDEVPKQQKVEFKGVSFTYNPQIFGEVKLEEVAEYPLEVEDFKPDGVEPQHRLFTFDLATGFSEMYLAVYPINDFPRMYARNKSSVKFMEKEIRDLKKILKDKNFRVENRIPYLRYIDASQKFQAKVKHFNFQSGKGILFLTFWETQLELPIAVFRIERLPLTV